MKPIQPDCSLMAKEVRWQLALNHEDLARELRVSYTTVKRWENGQAKPSKLAGPSWVRSVSGCRKKGFLFYHRSKTVSDPAG